MHEFRHPAAKRCTITRSCNLLVLEKLAADLQEEFSGIRGLSASNIWRMKGFYQAYADYPKLAPMVREIGWSHNMNHQVSDRLRNWFGSPSAEHSSLGAEWNMD